MCRWTRSLSERSPPRPARRTSQHRSGHRSLRNTAPMVCAYNLENLTLAHLCLGNLPAARAATESVRLYDVPEISYLCLSQLGVVALRQGDSLAAREAFNESVLQAERLLRHTPQPSHVRYLSTLASADRTWVGRWTSSHGGGPCSSRSSSSLCCSPSSGAWRCIPCCSWFFYSRCCCS